MQKSFFNRNWFKKRTFILTILLSSIIAISSVVYYTVRYQTNITSTQLSVVPEIVPGKIITLKALKEDYFLDFHNMFSATVRKNLEFPEHITLSYSISLLREEKEKAAQGKMLYYLIFDNKDNKVIGFIEIRDLNDEDPGQLGVAINEHYWGGGRFQEALALISKTYFTLKPQETKYNAYVRLWNKRSYYGLKKFGFKDAGFTYNNKNEPSYQVLELERSQVMK